ncbi:MAG: helix-turn-helix transcriptional regulator [Pseudomonadota bacterium]
MGGKEKVPFHNRLAMLRAERGLSRKDLAEQTGIHYQTIGYIERREYNPTLDLAFRLAKALDVSLDAIFSPEPFTLLSSDVLADRSS